MHESLTNISNEDDELPEINFDYESPMTWSEGGDQYKTNTEADFWRMWGLPEECIPVFNKLLDKEGLRNPHTDPQWFKEPQETIVPLQPRWHQMLGAQEMLTAAFKGDSTLLMDEVGLGKTMQMVMVIALLDWFRQYWEQHKKFPGAFGE